MQKSLVLFAVLLMLVSILPQGTARADIAPPETPPGVTLLPGEESTQVRMVAETVTLTISADPSDAQKAVAETVAVFTMRNLGAGEERMQVRFPLSFFDGSTDGWMDFPEIPSIEAKVNGQVVPTTRKDMPAVKSEAPFSYPERDELPWAVFDAVFPPNEDVVIEVTYTVNGFGNYPNYSFKYIMETGAGWNGAIGSAEIIARFPYAVGEKNVFTSGMLGFDQPNWDVTLSGNEIRWQAQDFEPTWEHNIEFSLIAPSLWQSVLDSSARTAANPDDAEAWGALAEAYWRILYSPRGSVFYYPHQVEMYELAKAAYENHLMRQPGAASMHLNYAWLMWDYYLFMLLENQPVPTELMPVILRELQTVRSLDPGNEDAKFILIDIAERVPDAVQRNGDDFIFLIEPAPPMEAPPAAPEPAPDAPAESPPADSPAASNPLCGSAFLLPAFLGMIFVLKRRK